MQLVEQIKAGQYVRRTQRASKTYVRGQYDRSTGRYSLIDCDDINREIFVRKGTPLFTGFTY
jgi:hypothetical protein